MVDRLMATKKQATRKRKIDRLISKWKKKLNLQEWNIIATYSGIDKDNCAAEIRILSDYFFGDIIVHNCYFNNTPHAQEEIIVHELCHCITEKAYIAHVSMLNYKVVTVDHINMIREQLTQRIATIAFPVGEK